MASWNDIHSMNDNNRKWSSLITVIMEAHNKSCPVKDIKVPDTVKPLLANYMTEGLLESRKTLHKLSRKANKDPASITDGISNMDRFNTFKKEYFKTRRKAKRKYFNEKFSELRHDCKSTWQLINSLIKRKSSNNIIDELIIDGVSITNTKKICDQFNNFFANVGTTEAKNIPTNDTDPMSFMRGLPPESMYLHPTDEDEIKKEAKKLNKKRSSGWDDIPSFLLLQCIEEIAPILAHCINDSFSTGNFAQCLKLALVIPLHKKKEKTNPTNYRPVSLLVAISKIIEKIIFKRIYNYMKNKLTNEQFGFRPKHCTSDLMIYLMEKINEIINQDKFSMVLFFDLAKAFDTLDHTILFRKLERYGIRGPPLDLIKSYLTNRSQKVVINNIFSSELPITIGVPQGSILGPLLFLIYINDINQAVSTAKLGLYADDTTAIIGAKEKNELITKSSTTLNELGNWFSCNKLSLSPTKCKYSMINKHLRTEINQTALSIYGKNLTEIRANSETTSNPFVGYQLSEKLDSKEHINHIQKKIRSGIYALRQHQSLPEFSKKNMYFALIHSHIGYASVITTTAQKGTWKPIQKLQNQAIRIICNKPYNSPSDPLYKKLKILKVEDLLKNCLLSYAWKSFHSNNPTAIDELINKGSERSLNIIMKNYNSTTIRNMSPIFHMTRYWNDLPLEIKRSESINSFLDKVKNLAHLPHITHS